MRNTGTQFRQAEIRPSPAVTAYQPPASTTFLSERTSH
jgi:hypothetical protein